MKCRGGSRGFSGIRAIPGDILAADWLRRGSGRSNRGCDRDGSGGNYFGAGRPVVHVFAFGNLAEVIKPAQAWSGREDITRANGEGWPRRTSKAGGVASEGEVERFAFRGLRDRPCGDRLCAVLFDDGDRRRFCRNIPMLRCGGDAQRAEKAQGDSNSTHDYVLFITAIIRIIGTFEGRL
jgi:hypothetical protein